jgi:hypothetical protein
MSLFYKVAYINRQAEFNMFNLGTQRIRLLESGLWSSTRCSRISCVSRSASQPKVATGFLGASVPIRAPNYTQTTFEM